ncbi:hypothetical protein [Burkholderia sp. Bp9031]|uniref:hypothetical protein n=1 Tax=Burkholderia sp. Bp9031 TaxID=2184566 RepID=UPI000F5D577F|nr:hypothetical protein [Burkholderia sp. Bp9031]
MPGAKAAASDAVARGSGAFMREDTMDDRNIVDAIDRTDLRTDKKPGWAAGFKKLAPAFRNGTTGRRVQ